jgi:hypothetical protein
MWPGSLYIAGGTLRPGTPCYVWRGVDDKVYDHLLASDICYVLAGRQMGKSSLMASTSRRLAEKGVNVATIDLSQIGAGRSTAASRQWLFSVVYEIHRRLSIAEPFKPWWQSKEVVAGREIIVDFFRELVLRHISGQVVIFVDEIDSAIDLSFASDFFAAIRICWNERPTDPAFRRLTFALFGVAAPNQFGLEEAQSPFSIGQRIELSDFSIEEAQGLAAGLHAETAPARLRLSRVFYWTEGQPYLTLALCRALAEGKDDSQESAEVVVDRLVGDMFLSPRAFHEESHLRYISSRLERGDESIRLLRLYLLIYSGKIVEDSPASSLFTQLKLCGLVRVTAEGNLALRNRIYSAVFTSGWVKASMPRFPRLRILLLRLRSILRGTGH